MSRRLLALLLILMTLSSCQTTTRHFWEIPASDADYIAYIRQHPEYGTAVIYNTRYCETIGAAACGFFRAQAHAHSDLNHQILPPDHYPESQIAEADCWAARNATLAEVRAAYDFLSNKDRDPDIPVVGDPITRADNIRQCAQAADNWKKETQ